MAVMASRMCLIGALVVINHGTSREAQGCSRSIHGGYIIYKGPSEMLDGTDRNMEDEEESLRGISLLQ